MKIPTVLVVISLILFYVIIPLLIWILVRDSRLGKIIVIVFTILFGVVLYFGITSRVVIDRDFVLLDIDYSGNWCDKTINLKVFSVDIIDLIINILMLIPIGLVVSYFVKSKITNKLVVSAVVGVVIGVLLETMQFVLPVYRSVQLSDAILNTVSVVIGCCVGLLYDRLYYKIRKGRQWRHI